MKTPGFLASVDLARMPKLKGRTATVLKDGAMELVATDEEDPLLAFWPIGLGRTAVFASDVKDRWAADWVRWRGYGPFFASVVRALQRQHAPPVSLEITPGPVRADRRTIAVAIEARDANGQYRNLLSPAVQVRTANAADGASGNSGTSRVVTRQVAPGRYEATVMADATQPITIGLDGPDANTSAEASPAAPSCPTRRRSTGSVRPTRRCCARSRRQPAAPGIRRRPRSPTPPADSRTARRPLWPWLMALALLLWFVDLLLRRVRIFEPKLAEA